MVMRMVIPIYVTFRQMWYRRGVKSVGTGEPGSQKVNLFAEHFWKTFLQKKSADNCCYVVLFLQLNIICKTCPLFGHHFTFGTCA